MITIISVLFTSIILALLRWLENGEETPTKRVIAVLSDPFVVMSAPGEARRGPGLELETLNMSKYV